MTQPTPSIDDNGASGNGGNPPEARKRTLLLTSLTCFNVGMQLASALLLKLAPVADRHNLLLVAGMLAVVLCLNLARFFTWGALHRRFPLSVAYPASAIFFPALLVMAWWLGEPIGLMQIIGATLVLTGVAVLLTEQART